MEALTFTKEQSLVKIRQYCAYQERCHAEVRDKLYSFKLHKQDVEQILAQLIQENFLNEERFAIHFAGGKFRMKQWGKIKITHALKQKKISQYLINKALKQILESDYKRTLNKLAEQKLKSLKSTRNIFEKKKKIYDFLMQKGYEGNIISQAVDNITNSK